MLKQASLCFVNYYNTLNDSYKSIFCFYSLFSERYKSVKIFNVHIMPFITMNYKQKIHWVFKFLIWNANWKSQFVFITKHINARIKFPTGNSILSQSRSLASFLSSRVILSECIFTGLIRLTWHRKNTFDLYFWCWLVLFWDFLILQAILHKNSLIMVYKLKR